MDDPGRSCACNAERDRQMPLWRSECGPLPSPPGESQSGAGGGAGRTTEGRGEPGAEKRLQLPRPQTHYPLCRLREVVRSGRAALAGSGADRQQRSVHRLVQASRALSQCRGCSWLC